MEKTLELLKAIKDYCEYYKGDCIDCPINNLAKLSDCPFHSGFQLYPEDWNPKFSITIDLD